MLGARNLQGSNDYTSVGCSNSLSLFIFLRLRALASSDRWRCQSDWVPLLCRSEGKSVWATDVKHCLFFLNMWPDAQLSSLVFSPPACYLRDYLRPLNGNSHCEKTLMTVDCSSATNGTTESVGWTSEHQLYPLFTRANASPTEVRVHVQH